MTEPSVVLDGAGRLPSHRIEGGRIVEVARAASVPRGARRLDCAWTDGVVVEPGRVNAHTHLYSGLAPLGLPPPEPPPDDFVGILERVWWRLDRALDAEAIRASARLYVAEALLAGTTALVDHHESPNRIEGSLDLLADAADDLGIRLVACYGATERNGGRAEARAGLAECRRFATSSRRPLVRAMVGLHASFTVTDGTVREAGELARELAVPVHVHVAEDVADVRDARERGYAGPLERLVALGAAPPGSVLAHGVHLDGEQVRRAADLGCWLVQNPRSNEGNRVGYPPALGGSDRVALGTDGYPADMDAERTALGRLAREHGDAAAMDESLLDARAGAGRRILEELFGGVFAEPVTTGHTADLVVRARGEPRPRHVLVGGRVVVEDGRLLTADEGEIRTEAERVAARLWARMAGITSSSRARRT